jgi:hypothetical protein
MKKYTLVLSLFFLILFTFTSCDILGGIFNTGVGVGIFIAVVVVILILFISRIGRRKL